MKNVHKNWVRKYEGKRALGRPSAWGMGRGRCGGGNMMQNCGLDSSGLAYDLVEDSHEHSSENLHYKKKKQEIS